MPYVIFMDVLYVSTSLNVAGTEAATTATYRGYDLD